ncbi:hypothetical protein D3C78_1399460 [compost metagenome]
MLDVGAEHLRQGREAGQVEIDGHRAEGAQGAKDQQDAEGHEVSNDLAPRPDDLAVTLSEGTESREGYPQPPPDAGKYPHRDAGCRFAATAQVVLRSTLQLRETALPH